MPAYNHTREDSALTPCPICKREAEIEEGHASGLRQMRRDDEVRGQELDGRLQRLGAVIDLLRSKGVERMDFPADLACVTGYVGGMMSLYLRPEEAQAPSPATVADVAHADEEEKCACGCLKVEEHNAQGLCIGKGCPVSLCGPEVKPPAVPV